MKKKIFITISLGFTLIICTMDKKPLTTFEFDGYTITSSHPKVQVINWCGVQDQLNPSHILVASFSESILTNSFIMVRNNPENAVVFEDIPQGDKYGKYTQWPLKSLFTSLIASLKTFDYDCLRHPHTSLNKTIFDKLNENPSLELVDEDYHAIQVARFYQFFSNTDLNNFKKKFKKNPEEKTVYQELEACGDEDKYHSYDHLKKVVKQVRINRTFFIAALASGNKEQIEITRKTKLFLEPYKPLMRFIADCRKEKTDNSAFYSE